MNKMELIWELCAPETELPVVRYCSNCKDRVNFQDSMKRRHNANGKDIFEYAIYKCKKGHTWNKLLRSYKAAADGKKPAEEAVPEKTTVIERIHSSRLIENRVEVVEIFLRKVEGRWRLDKLLAEQLEDVSRSQVERMIADGFIKVDGEIVKPGSHVKSSQRIFLRLRRE